MRTRGIDAVWRIERSLVISGPGEFCCSCFLFGGGGGGGGYN